MGLGLSGMVATPAWLSAQPAASVRRVTWLDLGSAYRPFQDTLRSTLRERGWVEGRDVAFEWNVANNEPARLAPLARDAVARNPDVIVAPGTTSINAAHEATKTIPIVMAGVGDPSRFVKSLRRPGGNVTGVSLLSEELLQENFEVLRRLLPQLRTLTLIRAAGNPGNPFFLEQAELVGKKLGIRIVAVDVVDFGDFARTLTRPAGEAAFMLSDPTFAARATDIAGFALKHKIPVAAAQSLYADAGFLLSYGPDYLGVIRQAGTFVDRILRGEHPADLPVEPAYKLDLIMNLSTAKLLGISVPASVLGGADRIIE